MIPLGTTARLWAVPLIARSRQAEVYAARTLRTFELSPSQSTRPFPVHRRGHAPPKTNPLRRPSWRTRGSRGKQDLNFLMPSLRDRQPGAPLSRVLFYEFSRRVSSVIIRLFFGLRGFD